MSRFYLELAIARFLILVLQYSVCTYTTSYL